MPQCSAHGAEDGIKGFGSLQALISCQVLASLEWKPMSDMQGEAYILIAMHLQHMLIFGLERLASHKVSAERSPSLEVDVSPWPR